MRRSFLSCALGACLFLLIVSAKWATFDRFGSAIPDWDQWDAEALELLAPWFENDHFLTHLWHPHNEHRVVLTKLQNLALVLVNGQWDSRLEAVTNAVLHAALAVGFWGFVRRWIAARWQTAAFLLIAALFALPIAWQNILGGFHSQQYWLLGLSFLAIVTLPFARTWSASWWLGACSAVLALGSMGSGFLAAAIVIAVIAWRWWQRETTLRDAWPAWLLMSAIVAFGLLTRVEVYWHQEMKAKTVHDFVFSIVHSLQWPLRHQHWAAVVMWLPWAVVTWHMLGGHRKKRPEVGRIILNAPGLGEGAHPERRVRDNAPYLSGSLLTHPAPQTIAALGGWVLVQIVATAYARGAGAGYPASRYMDTLTFGATVNVLALGWLLSTGHPALRARLARYLIALAWVVTLAVGLFEICERNLRHEMADARAKYYTKAEGNLRRYLATNDPKQLASPDIPFPSAEGLIERLARPSIRALMPLPIRAPLAIAPQSPAEATRGFRENNGIDADPAHPPRVGLSPSTPPLDYTRTWGSFTTSTEQLPGNATWTSASLTAPLGAWLKFETAGDLAPNVEGIRLTLHDAATRQPLVNVIPTRKPGDSWRSAYVRAPRVPFVVVATDTSPAGWLAFSAPTEFGHFSYLAWQATKHAALLFWIVAVLTFFLAVTVACMPRAERSTSLRP